MKFSNYLNIVLSLGLVALGWQYAAVSNDKGCGRECAKAEPSGSAGNAAIENIMTRSSIRSYTDEPVSDEDMEAMLRAGMAAPTARDSRPWHFVVVTDRKTMARAAEAMPNASMAAKAAALIIVCGDTAKMLDGEGKDYWIQDCSAATENILLAAHALGLGAVWCGVTPVQQRVAVTRSIFKLADNLVPLCIIAAGHPSGEGKVKDKWDESNVTRFTP